MLGVGLLKAAGGIYTWVPEARIGPQRRRTALASTRGCRFSNLDRASPRGRLRSSESRLLGLGCSQAIAWRVRMGSSPVCSGQQIWRSCASA